MAIVRLPKQAVTKVDLPAVCVATGATEDVDYHQRRFQFVPRWARLSLVFCGLIGIILMFVSVKRVQVDVPFSGEAYGAWVRAKRTTTVLAFTSLALLLIPLAFGRDLFLVGCVAFFAAVIALVAYSVTTLKKTGPICREIDDESVVLEIPSEAAARAIEQRLGLDGTSDGDAPATSVPITPAERDKLDERIQAELDRL